MSLSKRISPGQALQKLRHYCAYQERCHSEVMQKLYGWGVYKREAELLLSTLIEEGYLNEERFAIQFAGGKFRIKQWGRMKIEYALKQKQVSSYCIKKALAQIEEEDYNRTLERLILSRWELLKGNKESVPVKKKKLQDYLVHRGYEYPRVIEKMKQVLKG